MDASHAMRDKLVEYGMTASMSRKGNCWDAPTESCFNSLKNERVHGTRYATRAEAEAHLVLANSRGCDNDLIAPAPLGFIESRISACDVAFRAVTVRRHDCSDPDAGSNHPVGRQFMLHAKRRNL